MNCELQISINCRKRISKKNTCYIDGIPCCKYCYYKQKINNLYERKNKASKAQKQPKFAFQSPPRHFFIFKVANMENKQKKPINKYDCPYFQYMPGGPGFCVHRFNDDIRANKRKKSLKKRCLEKFCPLK